MEGCNSDRSDENSASKNSRDVDFSITFCTFSMQKSIVGL